MEVTFLVGSIFSPIASILGMIMNAIYWFFNLFGIENIALSIFVFTFIMKMLMLPLTIKQQKSTRLTSRMNPELQAIQAKYKGKKDEASMRKMKAETDAVYQKYGGSPAAGCLPMLIMLPIMFALYEVINNIPQHVHLVREQYNIIAEYVLNNNLVADVVANVSTKAGASVGDLTTTSSVINVLAKFTVNNWNALAEKVSDANSLNAIAYIKNVGNFFGLNIANNPDWKSVAIIIPILAMALQFIQSKTLQVKSVNSKDDPTAGAMNSMNYVMPIMTGFFCLMLPIGVGIYWIANSLFSIVQQVIVNKHLDKIDIDDMIEQNLEKAQKKYAGKNNSGVSLTEMARKQTKAIETQETKNSDKDAASSIKESQTADNSERQQPTSITDIANLLKNRNEKGDK